MQTLWWRRAIEQRLGTLTAVAIVLWAGATAVAASMATRDIEAAITAERRVRAHAIAARLETDGSDWDPMATSAALTDAVRRLEATDGPFDLILVGNESADSGGYQVGIRVAVALDRPVVTGIKALEIDGPLARARRQVSGGWDVFELPLPAVVCVREGINLPRYPSVPGRLRAKKKEIDTGAPERAPGGPTLDRLRLPVEQEAQVEILGNGPEAAPRVVEVLREIGVV